MANISAFATAFGGSGTRGGFSNEERWEKFEVDFTSDSTAAGTNVEIFGAGADLLITDFYGKVTSRCIASTTTAAIRLGINASGTDIINGLGIGALTTSAAYTVFSAHGSSITSGKMAFPLYMDEGDAVMLNYHSSDSNALFSDGVVDLWFKLKKV